MLDFKGRRHRQVTGAIASSAHHIEQLSITTVIIHGSNAAYKATTRAWNYRNIRTQPPGSPYESPEIALVLPIKRRSSDQLDGNNSLCHNQTTGRPNNLLNEISMTPSRMASPKHIPKYHACFARFPNIVF